jgi:hypothetical protein
MRDRPGQRNACFIPAALGSFGQPQYIRFLAILIPFGAQKEQWPGRWHKLQLLRKRLEGLVSLDALLLPNWRQSTRSTYAQ